MGLADVAPGAGSVGAEGASDGSGGNGLASVLEPGPADAGLFSGKTAATIAIVMKARVTMPAIATRNRYRGLAFGGGGSSGALC